MHAALQRENLSGKISVKDTYIAARIDLNYLYCLEILKTPQSLNNFTEYLSYSANLEHNNFSSSYSILLGQLAGIQNNRM